jgi:hypothetical protein
MVGEGIATSVPESAFVQSVQKALLARSFFPTEISAGLEL